MSQAFNDTFLKACRREETDHTPVWFMRQAGRYQASYRKVKETYSIKDICRIPEVSASVTLLPIQEFGLDTAILFSDIMIPLEPMGIDFDYKPGVGPVIDNPVVTRSDVEALKEINPSSDLAYTGESLKILKEKLSVPCIGFCGAPFTLASYMIEGAPTKNYIKLKSFMYNQEDDWNLLMEKLSKVMASYLIFQIESGASAVQLFDSWIGILSEKDFRRYVLPHTHYIVDKVKEVHPDVPFILFGTNTSHLFKAFNETKADVLGVDWKMSLTDAYNIVDGKKAIQGNLDPTLLFSDWNLLEERAMDILNEMKGKPGFIFNLGHGILPGTPPENVKRLTELVQKFK